MIAIPKKAIAAISAIAITAGGIGANCLSSYAYTTQANEVVSYAESTVGVIYGRPNVVTDYYGAVGEWCAMFVQYCAAMVGAGDKVPYSSYCDDYIDEYYNFKGGISFFKERGSYYPSMSHGGSYIPERGDVIYFDWANDYGCRDGIADHVGYVRGVYDGRVYTCEGNSHDMVKNQSYPIDSGDIIGYGKPAYDSGTISSPTVQPTSPTVSSPSVAYDADTYIVSSDIGAWARYSSSFGNNKIGIVSTGTTLISDRKSGSWVHFSEIPVEGSFTTYDGWINISTLTQIGFAETQQPDEEETEQGTLAEASGSYVSSDIGAWFRSSAAYGEANKMGIISSYTNVDVINISGEWLYVGAVFNGEYTYGYIHNSMVYREESADPDGTEGEIYRITSEIGAKFREVPDYDDSRLIAILDTDQQIEVISCDGEWAYIKANVWGYPAYGYTHVSNFS